MGAVIEHSELIDTCWDVNTRFIVSNPYLNIELIDTCWDVNLHDKDVNPTGEAELIDTCWNVNIKKGHSLDYTL